MASAGSAAASAKADKMAKQAREAGEVYFRLLKGHHHHHSSSSSLDNNELADFDQVEEARLHAVQAVKDLQHFLETNKFALGRPSANEADSAANNNTSAAAPSTLSGTSAQMVEFSLDTVNLNAQTVQRMLQRATAADNNKPL